MTIMDKDTGTRDDFVGELSIPIKILFQEGKLPPMKRNVLRNKRYYGEIKVGLSFTPSCLPGLVCYDKESHNSTSKPPPRLLNAAPQHTETTTAVPSFIGSFEANQQPRTVFPLLQTAQNQRFHFVSLRPPSLALQSQRPCSTSFAADLRFQTPLRLPPLQAAPLKSPVPPPASQARAASDPLRILHKSVRWRHYSARRGCRSTALQWQLLNMLGSGRLLDDDLKERPLDGVPTKESAEIAGIGGVSITPAASV
ncbi:hypothetical protein M0R45_025809 [Rubus argutus]|uniref:Uncharacterized protein n=1 Tax=Rubus argutus TaxID=59490 RepID=A0AAW1WXH5_RUBAR